jgi:polar amino acid transport system substrate-binding protein
LSVLLGLALLCVAGCDSEQRAKEEPGERQPKAAPPKVAASGGNLKRIQDAKVLRIGVKSDSPPFCYQDKEGNPQGFDVDLGFRLARGLGVQPLFVFVTPAERIERLKKGEIDVVIATLTATRRRGKEIDFSLPYYQDQQGLLVKQDSPIKSYHDLAGKKVGAATGTTSIDNIKIAAPDVKIVSEQSVAAAFEKLKAGEVDAITSDSMQLEALRLNSDPAQYRLAGEGFSIEPYVVGLPQNDSEFRHRVDEVLTDIWTTGAWTRLFNKWLGAQSPYNQSAKFQMPILPP